MMEEIGKQFTLFLPVSLSQHYWPLAMGSGPTDTEMEYEVWAFKKYFIHLFQREWRGGRKRGRKSSVCWCLLCAPTSPACNLGMCPDWESNWRPFGHRCGTEPHQPGLKFRLLRSSWSNQVINKESSDLSSVCSVGSTQAQGARVQKSGNYRNLGKASWRRCHMR